MCIKDLKILKSTKTLLIPVESLQLLRNFANPYLITKGLCQNRFTYLGKLFFF